MKLLVPDNQHGLTLALAKEIAPRHDIELLAVDGLSAALKQLDGQQIDAIVIPPLANPEQLSLTAIERHVVLVETLLASCQRCDMMLVWCVGNQLFEQDNEHLLAEDDAPAPISAGLQLLVAVEASIREQWPRHIILRVSDPFGSEGEGMWLPRALSQWIAGGAVSVEDHLFSAPVPVEAIARAVIGMVMQLDNGANAWGTYHFSGQEPVSQYEFAGIALSYLQKAVADQVPALPEESIIIRSGKEGTVRRILCSQKILMTFGIHQAEWRVPLETSIRQWLKRHSAPPAPDNSERGAQ